MHINFGNEDAVTGVLLIPVTPETRAAQREQTNRQDVGSWIRVVLVAPSPALRTAMAWLGKRQLAARLVLTAPFLDSGLGRSY